MHTSVREDKAGNAATPFRFHRSSRAARAVLCCCGRLRTSSREDPFPSVVLEAMDAQIPVVAFEGTSGFGQLLQRGCGILAPAFDTDAMAAAIVKIFNDPKLAAQMGEIGSMIVKSEFNFRQYVQDLLALPEAPYREFQ